MLVNAVGARLLVAVAIIVTTASSVTTLASAADPAIPAAPTAFTTGVTRLSPVDPAGNLLPSYRIRRHFTVGNCESGSTYTGTAYRCAARQAAPGVLDPCWVASSTTYVICLAKPWSHSVVRLDVTGGYDNSAGLTHVRFPWGVELPHQTRCLRNIGGVALAAGHPITYYCSNRTVIVGTLQRDSAMWRAHTYRRTTTSPHRYVAAKLRAIATAWFGLASRAG